MRIQNSIPVMAMLVATTWAARASAAEDWNVLPQVIACL
jgi:hypothetical protein